MLRLLLAVVIVALVWTGSALAEQPLSLNKSNVGTLGSNKAGEFVLPHAGPAP